MSWRRSAAWVVMTASALATAGALASAPADAKLGDDPTPCVLDPDTGGCIPDRDRDGRGDTTDNCPDHYNPGQEDNDGDNVGNACDPTPNGEGGGGGGGGGGGDGGGGGSTTSCGTGDGVYLYQHVDYQGGCFKLTQDVNHGYYFTGVGNDQLSSVRIIGPYSVTLYVDPWYGGGSMTLTSSSPNPWNWYGGPGNDNVSSARLLLDNDHDGYANHLDNCPDYYSRDNRCDADTSGSVEEDEEGVVATSPAPSSTTEPSATSGCHWRRIGRKHHNLLSRPLIRYNLRVDWCWNASVITSVNVRVWPEALIGCCWRFTRHLAYDVYDTAQDLTYYASWGRAYFKVFVQGEFQLCFTAGIDLGCPRTVYPWIELTAHRGGTSTKTSGGTR